MIVNSKEILNKAKKGKYAIPHFNINNLEWTRYILEECNINNSPVIIGVSENAAEYMGGYKTVANMVRNLDEYLNIEIPVVIHLDHGKTAEECKKAIDAGFTSVMIDGSEYSLEDNIQMTKEVVEYAEKYTVSVEAEVGLIGRTEDAITSKLKYATVEDTVRLCKETKVDFVAPALGSVHGLYKGEPNLDFEKMEKISKETNLPLVLHGGTGIPDDSIKKAINAGVSKININTELQIVWSNAVKKFLSVNGTVYDPRKIIKSGEEAMKQAIKTKINLLKNN